MKPFNLIEYTRAVFQPSTITYSQVGIAYSSGTVKYGGSDRSVAPPPQNPSQFFIKPQMIEVV